MPSTANIVVCVRRAALHSDADTEMCEHKGVGHPDTLCDNAVEAAARALSLAYLDEYGAVQHFNLDKALLIGGLSAPKFRGGRLLRPMRLIVSGPVAELASQSAEAIIQEAIYAHLKATLDVDSSMIAVEPAVRASAPSLRRVNGPAAMPLANDTSFGVGYAPLSRLEQQVKAVADILNSDGLRSAFPAIGRDYKVMGHRVGDRIALTLAAAFVDRWVGDVADYFAVKARVAQRVGERLGPACTLRINTLDDPGAHDQSGLYLTVTGLSAEQGDDGEVGRGNRVNGLITPYRPMSLEAAAGKNPVAHVGKLYNVLAHQLAQRILNDVDVDGVVEVTVRLLSAIGQPIDQPQLAAVDVCAPDGLSPAQRRGIDELVKQGLSELPALTRQLVNAEIRIC
ncbi:methionine adenosyltransferase [Burkholderia vietnamiensis]|nr:MULTISPECIES: methionine adenosyltransferase [Burkholderia cepacia complex]MBR8048761.1 methionine adenosyltransferase [Burkholderia multivorans]MCA8292040.1 methionine adenosyltransferase [Burkholderia vietnamiensis]